MDQLSIVNRDEWWIIWENGYGEHGIKAKASYASEARSILILCREARPDRTFEVQKVTIKYTTEKLDW